MNTVSSIFAALSAGCLATFGSELLAAVRDHVSLFGAFATVILLAITWALYGRKPGGQHSRLTTHSGSTEPAGGDVPLNDPEAGLAPARHRKRRRRRRREHRPRNPTLAETGGLPPVRAETPPEASA